MTSKSISTKTKLTLNFMKLKMKEYDELKRDIENDLSDNKKKIINFKK